MFKQLSARMFHRLSITPTAETLTDRSWISVKTHVDSAWSAAPQDMIPTGSVTFC
jgi:hypothetical protein